VENRAAENSRSWSYYDRKQVNRREFLRSAAIVCSGAALCPREALAQGRVRQGLADRFSDLSRHFIFEYYAWYRANPYWHWNQSDRNPPIDLASNYMPRLGAYDSRSAAVMEQHAKWIAESGAGAINVSWWGRDSDIDALVPALMDVMRAHDIHVAFHIEPYDDRHAYSYASDVEYLITQYGDRRHWDCMLLLQNADGSAGPVFKSFRTIVPAQSTDCHGVTSGVADYAADSVWRQQTDHVRRTFARDFDHVTLLADSLSVSRSSAGGFDGIAIYDNFVAPETWAGHAHDFSEADLLFSFNVNPGYDEILLRTVDPGSCYSPRLFQPGGGSYDWTRAADRERARAASESRIGDSFRTTIAVQTNAQLSNAKRGFFLTYINSFNEWHEGHQFEPMKDAAELTAEERAVGYHDPDDGRYRLEALQDLIHQELDNSI
jgi:glycoprotein endo-alpha-1,2-mannosidase